MWHPKAWNYAPRPIKLDIQPSNSLFEFQQGQIVRGKQTLFSVDDFELHKGEWLTITGENGAGKTSLLESILQLIKYKGRMTYNNEELKRLNKQQNTCISCIKIQNYNLLRIQFMMKFTFIITI